MSIREKGWSGIRDSLAAAYREGGLRGTTSKVVRYLEWRLKARKSTGPTRDEQRRERANSRLIASLEVTPWMQMVRSAQDEVAATPADDYFSVYRSQEANYWTEIARWLHETAAGSGRPRSLDVGCGYGTLSVFLANLFDGEVHCIDMLEDRFDPGLAQRNGLRFVAGNIEIDDALPWPGPFDLIVLTEVLEHLNYYPVPTLIKLRDALAPDGRLFLSTPDGGEWGRVTTYYQSLDEMPLPETAIPYLESGEWDYVDAHIWQYTQDELERVVAEAGFRVIRAGFAPGVVYRHFNLELALA